MNTQSRTSHWKTMSIDDINGLRRETLKRTIQGQEWAAYYHRTLAYNLDLLIELDAELTAREKAESK